MMYPMLEVFSTEDLVQMYKDYKRLGDSESEMLCKAIITVLVSRGY